MTPNMVIGIVFLFDTELYMLINPRVIHSFISYEFVAYVGDFSSPRLLHRNLHT